MPDVNFVHIENTGTANTPTAPDGLRIDYVVDGTRHEGGAVDITVSVTGTNSAVMDNAWAGVRIALLRNNGEVWSDIVQTDERCPARGFSGATVRSGSRQISVPAGVSFDNIGVEVRNIDNPTGTLGWASLVAMAALIVVF